jgi:Zn-dependent protease with chaperone function
MIIVYFLYFIIAILMYSAAPTASTGIFPAGQSIMTILVLIFGFLHYNRYKFTRLRDRLNHKYITLEQAKKEYFTRINIHFIIALVLFAIEVFARDLKVFCLKLSFFGLHEFVGNLVGLAVFMLHLSITWHWGYKAMGDVLELDDSAEKYVRSNIKFNLVIVLPWLLLSIAQDLLKLVVPRFETLIYAPYLREILSMLFLLFLVLFAPLFITRLWDCEPLPASRLRDRITAFCSSQGVKFRDIMSWNALGKGLVTAGVMGVATPFRYLMITPSLMNILDEDELMAVVSHEVGHAKKKHPLLYVVFFIAGFFILSNYFIEWVNDFLFTTPIGKKLITIVNGTLDTGQAQFYALPILILLIVVYLRFVFGYFMRNFERQADIYCFESNINSNHMINSFLKLKNRMGDDEKKNWHHYTLSQRIDFIRKAMENPEIITRHNKKVSRAVTAFILLMVLFTSLFYTIYDGQSDLKRQAAAIEILLEQDPEQTVLYAVLGESYYQLKEWKKAKKAFEYAISLDYNQPGVLNNFAWLLLTSEDESLKDAKRALKLAMDSVGIRESVENMDTLAEAYYQNEMYLEAYRAAKRTLKLATENRTYYKRQLEKMKKAVKEKTKDI